MVRGDLMTLTKQAEAEVKVFKTKFVQVLYRSRSQSLSKQNRQRQIYHKRNNNKRTLENYVSKNRRSFKVVSDDVVIKNNLVYRRSNSHRTDLSN